MKNKMICCICETPIIGYGNNAEPLAVGRCCDDCNFTKVVPFRINTLINRERNECEEKRSRTDTNN